MFADVSEDELLGYGVPAEWLADARRADEDTLLELADHLPSEAAEALLAIFLHPAQRALVERDYSGPARVAGSAGTGKTIVALHRAVFLVRANPDARVLLNTFSDMLANALRTKLRRLISNEPKAGGTA